MTTEQFEEKQAKMSNAALIGFCKEEISKLAETYGKSHKMCIPPQITDTDMLLCELVKRFEKASETGLKAICLLNHLKDHYEFNEGMQKTFDEINDNF